MMNPHAAVQNQDPVILLVEDNEDDVFLFRRALKKAQIGNPIHLVTDGEQAIQFLSGKAPFDDRNAYPMPLLIFLDLKLPYHSGFEILAWIRSQPKLKDAPVVILTSSAEPKDHEQASHLGVHSYLVKPPTPEVLLDLVRSFENSRGGSFQIGTRANAS